MFLDPSFSLSMTDINAMLRYTTRAIPETLETSDQSDPLREKIEKEKICDCGKYCDENKKIETWYV